MYERISAKLRCLKVGQYLPSRQVTFNVNNV